MFRAAAKSGNTLTRDCTRVEQEPMNENSNQPDGDQSRRKYVFVGGSPRSGTSLLGRNIARMEDCTGLKIPVCSKTRDNSCKMFTQLRLPMVAQADAASIRASTERKRRTS